MTKYIRCEKHKNIDIAYYNYHKSLNQGKWEHHYVFPLFIPKGTASETSCLLPWMTKPFQKGSTLKVKNLLTESRVSSPESVYLS